MFNHFSSFLSASICLWPNEWREGRETEREGQAAMKEAEAKEINSINGMARKTSRYKCRGKAVGGTCREAGDSGSDCTHSKDVLMFNTTPNPGQMALSWEE